MNSIPALYQTNILYRRRRRFLTNSLSNDSWIIITSFKHSHYDWISFLWLFQINFHHILFLCQPKKIGKYFEVLNFAYKL